MADHANPNDTSDAFDAMAESMGAGAFVEEEAHEEFIAEPQFGAPTEGVTEHEEQEFAPAEQHSDNDIPQGVDNPTSYKYFQSKYSKAQADKEALEQQLQQMQQLIQQQNQFSSGQPSVNQHNPALGSAGYTQAQQDLLKRPEAPRLPEDFDETDAFFDPESESYKARITQMQYLEQMGSYVDQRLGQMDQVFANMAMQEQERARNEAWRTQLQDTFQMEESEQEAFFHMLNDPEMLTLPNMVKMFRSMHGGQQVQSSQRRPRTVLPPTPSSVARSGAREQPRTATDSIMDNMLSSFGNPSDKAFGSFGK